MTHPFTNGLTNEFHLDPYSAVLCALVSTEHANKDDLMTAAHEKYCKAPKDEGEEIPPSSYPFEQEQKENHYPESEKSAHRHHEAKIQNTNGAGNSN